MWNSPLREKFNFYFLGVFVIIDKNFGGEEYLVLGLIPWSFGIELSWFTKILIFFFLV